MMNDEYCALVCREELEREGIRIAVLGELSMLSPRLNQLITQLTEATRHNSR